MDDGGVLVAVEVKTGRDPLLHATDAKLDAVRRTMSRLDPRPRRLDLVTVSPRGAAVEVRWNRAIG